MSDLQCSGCLRAIFEGDEVLILNFNEDLPEFLIHNKIECVLGLDEVSEGVLGPTIDLPKLTRIK